MPFGAFPLLISDQIGVSLVACAKKKKKKKRGEKCTCCSGKVAMETGDKYNKGNYALFAGKGRRVRSIVHIARAVVDRVRQMCVNHWQPR